MCFSEGDIVGHKATLLDPASSKHLLLNTLRKVGLAEMRCNWA